MARSVVTRIVVTELEGTRYLAVAKFLAADDKHPTEDRARGGWWVKADDRTALMHAYETAHEFAALCERRLAQLDAPAPAPKAARPPTQKPPKAQTAPAPTPAPAPAPAPTPAPAPVTRVVTGADRDPKQDPKRNAAIVKARATVRAIKAPAPKVAPTSPAPVQTAFDEEASWLHLMGIKA